MTLARCIGEARAGLVPTLSEEQKSIILDAYLAGDGDEIGGGKFSKPESSARLVANSFGRFLGDPAATGTLARSLDLGPRQVQLALEKRLPFPWRGGHRPSPDALVETDDQLVAIECKFFEPYRGCSKAAFSETYWRDVWGNEMRGFQEVRDLLRDQPFAFSPLDAAQLVKHALGLFTAYRRDEAVPKRRPLLIYLYAEPSKWPDGRAIEGRRHEEHRSEIARFSAKVSGDVVMFRTLTYASLFAAWARDVTLLPHVEALRATYPMIPRA